MAKRAQPDGSNDTVADARPSKGSALSLDSDSPEVGTQANAPALQLRENEPIKVGGGWYPRFCHWEGENPKDGQIRWLVQQRILRPGDPNRDRNLSREALKRKVFEDGLDAQYEHGLHLVFRSESSAEWEEADQCFRGLNVIVLQETYFVIGMAFHKGTGTRQSNDAAFYWWSQAAKIGSLDGLANVAGCYLTGQGVGDKIEKNWETGLDLMREASLLGSIDAEYTLQHFCLGGNSNRHVAPESSPWWLLVLDRDAESRRRVEREVSRLVQQLSDLSGPQMTEVFKALFERADFAPALRNAIDSLSAKGPEGSPASTEDSTASADVGKTLLKLEESKRDYETNLHQAMKEQVFNQAEPSISGFRAYLRQLPKQTNTSYDDKKDICKTVNYWKERLALDLLFEGRVCTLAPKTAGSRLGGFKLRSADAQQETLYARSTFPKLTVRSAER